MKFSPNQCVARGVYIILHGFKDSRDIIFEGTTIISCGLQSMATHTCTEIELVLED